jgi:hypothetical protein
MTPDFEIFGTYQQRQNLTITILEIIHRPVIHLKQNSGGPNK